MKLNNKGFAISSIMYIILILAVVLVALTLAILSSRKLILDKLKGEVTNAIYGAYPYTYRETLNILKEEAITYATANNITNDSIKISNFESSIDEEIINDYKLNDKYLTIKANNDSYDVYLGKTKTITDISKNTTNFIDVLDYKIEGNTYQQTYTGKNLFDVENMNMLEGYIGSTTKEYTDRSDQRTVYISIEPNTTYTVSKTKSNRFSLATFTEIPSNGVLSSVYSSTAVEGSDVTELSITSLENDKYLAVYCYSYELDTLTLDEVLNSIQIEKGSTATSYEPYVGGIASPNPDYPQEIESVGHYDEEIGKYKIPVKVSGKNLLNPNLILDGNKVLNGITWTRENGIITANGTATADSVYNIWNYNIGFDTSPLAEKYDEYNDSFSVSLCTDNEDTNKFYIRSITAGSNYANEYNNIGRYAVSFSITIPAGSTVENQVFKPMIVHTINDNIIDNDYEPYIEPITTNIYLDEPLRKLGEYSDSLDFSSNKIVRKNFEYVVTGDETYTLVDSTAIATQYDLVPNIKIMSSTNSSMEWYMLSHNPFIKSSFNYLTAYNPSQPTSLEFRNVVNNWKIPEYTVSAWETFAKAEFSKGTPITVNYVLESPIEQLVQLPKINTNNGSSIIEIDTDIAPTNVEFTIIEEIKQL